MAVIIPDSHKDLLEKPIVVSLTTVSAEGKPHATIVWRKFDGEHILVSCDYGVRKHRNIQANPHVSVLALDPDSPYRYLEIGGRAEIHEEGALELLDELTRFYMGRPQYFGEVEPLENQEKYRGVLLKISIDRIVKVG